jgi:hypothetical protein
MKLSALRNSSLPALIVLGSATVPACSGPPSVDTSLREATVTGIVTAKGVPATGGTISFNPSNYARKVPTRSAEIGPDGRYTVTTYTGDNVVTYGGAVATKNPGVGLRRDSATVQSGENKLDFDVLGESSKQIQFDLAKKGAVRRRR